MTRSQQPGARRFSPWWTGSLACAALLSTAALGTVTGCRRGLDEATPSDAIPAVRPIAAAELIRYAGSRSCVPCHPQVAGQLETHHAHTAGRISAEQAAYFRRPGVVRDREGRIDYRTRVVNGACELVATRGAKKSQGRADWAIGSGGRAFSYLGREDARLVELRLTYYTRPGRWDFTPGQQPGHPVSTPVGRVVGSQDARQCFTCHATALVEENGQPRPEQSILGIGCEACHGPGKDHIAAVQRGDRDLRMPRLTGMRDRVSMELCGQCHRSPLMGESRDAGIGSQLPRMQGLALARSACFRKSSGQLSCLTCHDPHRDADRTSHQEYNAQCGSCHRAHTPGQVACRFKPAGDCVSCHMPTQTVDLPTQPRYRTHWIKVWGKVEQ